MNNFSYKNLCPFKWFVLQNFPFIEADFDAITNWQLFCKLGEEMNKIIEKVNQAGEQTENLTNAFIDLQNYVNNYFENLDVQDEINNKLDEMAEGGQLADIIAQYLQLAGVLAFDTVTDMKVSENLTNGSIVRTLGYSNIQDSNGSYYKIRNVLNTDVIDGINIIALNNFQNLVAEKIKEKQDMISYRPTFLYDDYYFTISYEEHNRIYLYVSLDCINWKKVFELPKNILMEDCTFVADFSCIVDNGYFYLIYDYVNPDYNGWSDLNPDLFRGGNRIGVARTNNFIDWEKWNLPIDLQYKQTFAPEFFIDTNNKHYITISLSTTEIKTDSSNVSRYFKKNYIIETDETFHNIISTTNNLNVDFVNIDGFIYKENDSYYLAVKDEELKTIKIYSSSNILSFSNLISEVKMLDKENNINGIEAPSIIKINNFYILTVDVYSMNHTTAIFISQDLQHWSNWNLLNTPDYMFHFTPIKADLNYRNLLSKAYELFNYPALNSETSINGMINELNTDNYTYNLFVPLPNSTYIFYGGGTTPFEITPINYFFNNFKNKDFKIVNGSGIGSREIVVTTLTQNVQISVQNAQIFGFNWNNYSCYVYGANLTPLDFALNAGSNITINYQHCKRIGKIVNLNVSFTPTANISWFDLLFSNAPAVTDAVQFPIIDRNDANQETKWAYVQDQGEIQAQREFISGHNYRFNVTYICN